MDQEGAADAESMQLEARKFLPPAFQKKKNINITSVTMKCRRTSKGQNKVSCTIEWLELPKADEVLTSDVDESAELNSIPSTSSPSVSSTGSEPTALFETSQVKSRRRGAKASSSKSSCTCPHPREDRTASRRCDGPCGRVVQVRGLTLMGQCEHAVCTQCLENSPRVETCFGVLGCPNTKCFLFDSASLCPDKAKRLAQYRQAYAIPSNETCFNVSSRSSSLPPPSLSTQTSFEYCNNRLRTPQSRIFAKTIQHPVSTTFAIFRDDRQGKQLLQKQFYELPSTISIGAAFQSCISENPELARFDLSNRCFIGPSSFIEVLDRSTWASVNLDSAEPLYKLEDDKMRLMLIIDLVAAASRLY